MSQNVYRDERAKRQSRSLQTLVLTDWNLEKRETGRRKEAASGEGAGLRRSGGEAAVAVRLEVAAIWEQRARERASESEERRDGRPKGKWRPIHSDKETQNKRRQKPFLQTHPFGSAVLQEDPSQATGLHPSGGSIPSPSPV
jgi:hypothetical protein